MIKPDNNSHINPHDYWKIDNYIPSYICDEIIKNHDNFIEGGVTAYVGAEKERSDTRKSEIQWIKTPFYLNLVFDIFRRVNDIFQFDIESIESLQLTRYTAPDGQYDFHVDSNGYSRKSVNQQVRKLSMSCLLNDSDDFDGGVFQMNVSSDIYDIKLNKGDLIIFPSYFRHRVTPVTRGTRYSLVAWACGKPFR